MPDVAGVGELGGGEVAFLVLEEVWDGVLLCCARGEGARAGQADRVTTAIRQRMQRVWSLIRSMAPLLT